MVCNKCRNMIILNGFSKSNCIVCGNIIITSHTPSYIVCEECSKELNVCQQCGLEIE